MRYLRAFAKREKNACFITIYGKDDNYRAEIDYDAVQCIFSLTERNTNFVTTEDYHACKELVIYSLDIISPYVVTQYSPETNILKCTRDRFVIVKTNRTVKVLDKENNRLLTFSKNESDCFSLTTEEDISNSEKALDDIQEEVEKRKQVFGAALMNEAEIADSISKWDEFQAKGQSIILKAQKNKTTEIYKRMKTEGKTDEEIRHLLGFYLNQSEKNIKLPCDKDF